MLGHFGAHLCKSQPNIWIFKKVIKKSSKNENFDAFTSLYDRSNAQNIALFGLEHHFNHLLAI